MNYIKESEEILKNHRKLNTSLNNLYIRRNKIIKSGFPRELMDTSYDKPDVQHMNYSESTINEICEVMEINAQINETKEEMQLVDDILEQIKKEDEILEKFIKLKYITEYKKSMREIVKKLNYSENSNHTIYDIKKKALKEFAVLYFGVRGIKNT